MTPSDFYFPFFYFVSVHFGGFVDGGRDKWTSRKESSFPSLPSSLPIFGNVFPFFSLSYLHQQRSHSCRQPTVPERLDGGSTIASIHPTVASSLCNQDGCDVIIPLPPPFSSFLFLSFFLSQSRKGLLRTVLSTDTNWADCQKVPSANNWHCSSRMCLNNQKELF